VDEGEDGRERGAPGAAVGGGRLFFYANRSWENVIFRGELEELKEKLNLRIEHVMEDPPDGWEGERGYVTSEVIDRHLPDERLSCEYFVCGRTRSWARSRRR
jgi:NAD(P)H-flavin reductase